MKPITLLYAEQRDIEYGYVKFHHIYHDYQTYHDHDFFEVFLCYQGEYKQIINDKEYNFKKLDCCFLRPVDRHLVIELEKNSSHYSISIRRDEFTKFINNLDPSFMDILEKGDIPTFSLSESRFKKIIAYLNRIREVEQNSSEQNIINHFLLFNLVEPIFSQSNNFESGKRPQWLNELLIEINKPAHLNWGVSDVVAHSHYSQTHLARLFKEEMGKSLGEYLQEVKITNARDMLVNSDMCLNELCDIIGHSSLSNFSSLFKKYYGLPPGKYRSLNKKKE